MKTVMYKGVKIPILPIMSENILYAINNGYYEAPEASQINNLIQPQERVLEIGAGLGFISTLVLRNPNTEKFLGFEANPVLIDSIKTVFKLNNVNGEIVNAVLNHNQEEKELNFYLRNDFWSSSLEEKPWGYDKVIKVKTMLFNNVIKNFKPTMIICDIEGGELALFKDGCLLDVKKIYMEIHQQVLGRCGVRQLFDLMSSKGYHYDEKYSSGSVILFSHIDNP